jgi:NAD+ synthase (glutamine-hydrolysing)
VLLHSTLLGSLLLTYLRLGILEAKKRGATLRTGPELEICGYGCLDHFHEEDLYLHCWQMLLLLLIDEECYDILLDIGMPVMHRNNRFNW